MVPYLGLGVGGVFFHSAHGQTPSRAASLLSEAAQQGDEKQAVSVSTSHNNRYV